MVDLGSSLWVISGIVGLGDSGDSSAGVAVDVPVVVGWSAVLRGGLMTGKGWFSA